MSKPFYTHLKENPNGTYNLTNLNANELRSIYRSLESMESKARNRNDNFDNQINCARKILTILKTTPKNFELYKVQDQI